MDLRVVFCLVIFVTLAACTFVDMTSNRHAGAMPGSYLSAMAAAMLVGVSSFIDIPAFVFGGFAALLLAGFSFYFWSITKGFKRRP